MRLILEGEPKEIAALVLATQERREGADLSLFLDGKKIAQHSIDVLNRELNAGLKDKRVGR